MRGAVSAEKPATWWALTPSHVVYVIAVTANFVLEVHFTFTSKI